MSRRLELRLPVVANLETTLQQTVPCADNGQTWSDPTPTTLVHPDAPPMLFHLADGKATVAFQHNRHRGNYRSLDGANVPQSLARLPLGLVPATAASARNAPIPHIPTGSTPARGKNRRKA